MQSAGEKTRTDDDSGVLTPDAGTNVLLLSSAMERPPAPEYVTVPGGTIGDANVLTIALDRNVQTVTAEWRSGDGVIPAKLAVVGVDDQRGAAATVSGSSSTPANVWTTTVSSPGDLTGLGIELSNCLSSWETTGPTAVTVESLTTLLQYAELNRVFRLTHVLTSRIESAGAVGFFHLDPSAHDAQTVATLRGLFDAVYEYGPDGWQRP